MRLLWRVAGYSLRDRVTSSVTLLLHIERSHLRWLEHLFQMPPGRLLYLGRCLGLSQQEEAPGKTQDMLEGLFSRLAWECLGNPPDELEEVSRGKEGSLDGWMHLYMCHCFM